MTFIKSMDYQRNINNATMGLTFRSLLENHYLSNPAIVKQVTSKKDKEGSDDEEFNVTAAFLGPTLWDKTLSDFKLEYMDLDEFLNDQGSKNEPAGRPKTSQDPLVPAPAPLPLPNSENTNTASPRSSQPCFDALSQNVISCVSPESCPDNETLSQNDCPLSPELDSSNQSSSDTKEEGKPKVQINFKITQSDLALATVPGQDHFDPCSHTFSEDELKPQAMVKKSRKQFVPDTMKDIKYWARRCKNNEAAKRSREARRVKENQIVLRASYLEKENMALKEEVDRLKEANERLWQRLNKYEA